MSGHSKWHTIQKKKGATDAKRGQIFTKLAKAITVAVKSGGDTNPDFNFQLRVAIDQAKAANMPKDNVERAIKRGAGDANEGNIEEVIYEGFGPGNTGLLIQCLTDNRNRSVSEVRNVMNKKGGSMAGQGSVKWMYDRKGVVRLKEGVSIEDRDVFELAMIEAGAEDLKENEQWEIISSVEDLKQVLEKLNEHDLVVDSGAVEYVAKETLELSDADEEQLAILLEHLSELEDTDNVFVNAN